MDEPAPDDKSTVDAPRSRCWKWVAGAVFVLMFLTAVFVLMYIYVWKGSDSSSDTIEENGFDWSGYGCKRNCARGNNNFEIEAGLRTYTIPNAGAFPNADTGNIPLPKGAAADIYTRTFVGTSGNFCQNYDGSGGPLGPCLQVSCPRQASSAQQLWLILITVKLWLILITVKLWLILIALTLCRCVCRSAPVIL